MPSSLSNGFIALAPVLNAQRKKSLDSPPCRIDNLLSEELSKALRHSVFVAPVATQEAVPMALRRIVFGTLLILASVPRMLHAQGLTGQISGTVIDPQGAAVAGARAVLMNSETNLTRETVTDAQGSFAFTELLPGDYQIAVEAKGFKRYEEKQICADRNWSACRFAPSYLKSAR